MFEVIVKKSVRASHALRNVSENDETPHEHNWVIEAKFGSNNLDSSGCVVDFNLADKAILEIVKSYEGNLINDFEPFDKLSPSAENLARYIHEKLSAVTNAHLVSVTAWEDEKHGATYNTEKNMNFKPPRHKDTNK